MPFVVDASITACWAFDDEDLPIAALALERIRAMNLMYQPCGGSRSATRLS